ncbi:ATP-dependent RNA helicase DBP3-like [Rhodamnia argentea]|uniref:ATP-dependent RNA helicase DBP3-like n=1 Tax=Rhodamnia argentea TaxID=178133 RepID=A0ABM3H4R3_9MYRT|nr:ATP-dependent RNA helicase DBP3-like [Rhodamnia argentea]
MVKENYVAMVLTKFSNLNIFEKVKDSVAMIFEVNFATIESTWWVDSGATVHICKDQSMFKHFEEIVEVHLQEVEMANKTLAKVVGKDTVILDFTSEKKVFLLNVLFVPKIKRNLVYVDPLCKRGFRVLFESDKVILLKNRLFVGKGYANDGMMVIRYDFPTGVEDHIHRIGRTGRAGASGLAELIRVLEGANRRVPPEIRNMAFCGGGMGRLQRLEL